MNAFAYFVDATHAGNARKVYKQLRNERSDCNDQNARVEAKRCLLSRCVRCVGWKVRARFTDNIIRFI